MENCVVKIIDNVFKKKNDEGGLFSFKRLTRIEKVVKYRVSQKNVPHLNPEYLKNYERDTYGFDVIR